jgi:polar amino acid transport system substrate-binding protein
VRNGEADAVFADGDYLLPIAAEDADLMVILDPVQLGGGVGMGMREGDERLAAFDAAITAMKEDGTLNALILEWFGEDAATW